VLEAGLERLDRGGDGLLSLGRHGSEAHRADEVDRLGIAAEDLVERLSRLAQGEIESGRLERPAPVVLGDLALGRLGEEGKGGEQLGERVDRVIAGEVVDGAGVAEGDVVEAVIDDVLPDPLLPAAVDLDQRGEPLEGAEAELAPLELVALDGEGQVLDLLVGAHAPNTTKPAVSARG
jgi:hypothetical protein